MIESPQETDFKKAAETNNTSEFDYYDDGVEYVEYNLDQAEDRVQVATTRRHDADPAWLSKTGNDQDASVTKVLSMPLRHAPSKDLRFAFPETAASSMGLEHEDACVVVTDSTGIVALTQSPKKVRFVLQTPLDDGPFCALSVKHTTGFNYSALHLYSDPVFAPLRLVTNQMWEFDWRRNGLPILILPFAFLGIHDTYISDRLAQLHSELGQIESALLAPYRPDIEGLDFGQLTRRLHEFSTALSNLARRAHFQDTVLSTAAEALCTLNGPAGWSLEIQRARLDGLKKAMQGRRYDLEMMPKRELTARATIFNLVVQRDQGISLAIGQANLEMARSARQIAQATMRDSAAMRTIAVLTMLFLPGTAVASFFSMTMFNWTPSGGGNGSVSSYIWVYFVAAIPLTALVLGSWWYWQRVRERDAGPRHGGDLEQLDLHIKVA